MMFEDAPCLVDLVDVVGEDDVVGIAHRDEDALAHAPRGHKLSLVFQSRLAHVDGDGSYRPHPRPLPYKGGERLRVLSLRGA